MAFVTDTVPPVPLRSVALVILVSVRWVEEITNMHAPVTQELSIYHLPDLKGQFEELAFELCFTGMSSKLSSMLVWRWNR